MSRVSPKRPRTDYDADDDSPNPRKRAVIDAVSRDRTGVSAMQAVIRTMEAPPDFVYRVLSAEIRPEPETPLFTVKPGPEAVAIEDLGRLGRGTYGVVRKVRAKVDGRYLNNAARYLTDIKGDFAEKCMEVRKLKDDESPDNFEKLICKCDNAEEICMEIKCLRMLYNENVIRMYDAYLVERDRMLYACVALQLGDMDLGMYIEHHMPIRAVPDDAHTFSGIMDRVDANWFTPKGHYDLITTKIMAGIMRGLAEVHTKNIVHRDIKPGNIIMKGQTAMISDFGLSAVVGDDGSLMPKRDAVYTKGFRPPEACTQVSGELLYGKPADIWAAGAVYLCLVMRNSNYLYKMYQEFKREKKRQMVKSAEDKAEKKKTSTWLQFYEDLTKLIEPLPSKEFAKHLMDAYLHKEPKERWSADALALDLETCEKEYHEQKR